MKKSKSELEIPNAATLSTDTALVMHLMPPRMPGFPKDCFL